MFRMLFRKEAFQGYGSSEDKMLCIIKIAPTTKHRRGVRVSKTKVAGGQIPSLVEQ